MACGDAAGVAAETEDELARRQAASVISQYNLAPRYELTSDGSRYAYLWWAGYEDAGRPYGKWLPKDWFDAMVTPIPADLDEAAVVARAVDGFVRLPAGRRRALAGF
jgi:hypothetical protein